MASFHKNKNSKTSFIVKIKTRVCFYFSWNLKYNLRCCIQKSKENLFSSIDPRMTLRVTPTWGHAPFSWTIPLDPKVTKGIFLGQTVMPFDFTIRNSVVMQLVLNLVDYQVHSSPSTNWNRSYALSKRPKF